MFRIKILVSKKSDFSENGRRRCREIMTRNVKTASREMTLQEVAGLMRDGDMGAMPVVENEKLIGIVTDRDIVVRAIAEGKDAQTQIGDVMTTEIFSVKPDDFAFEAIRLMGDKQIRRIPVVRTRASLPELSRWRTSRWRWKTSARLPKLWKKSPAARRFGEKDEG